MDTIKTEISLLELLTSLNTVKKKIINCSADEIASLMDERDSLEKQIASWGKKSNVQYRIM
jgi:hypothetical protein